MDSKTPGSLIALTLASRSLGISRWALWRAVKAGEVPAVRIGRRYFLSLAQLEQLATRQAAERRRARRGEARP
jgi:excisionase family DNA binding protein